MDENQKVAVLKRTATFWLYSCYCTLITTVNLQKVALPLRNVQ